MIFDCNPRHQRRRGVRSASCFQSAAIWTQVLQSTRGGSEGGIWSINYFLLSYLTIIWLLRSWNMQQRDGNAEKVITSLFKYEFCIHITTF